MPRRKMLILRGNSADAGTYPDEDGKNIAWPVGALHVWAAREFARRLGYESVVLDIPGQPQGEYSPQTKAAVKKFMEDDTVAAFYGFSGGGYNMKHILDFLAAHHPESLHRIDLVVVLGAPKQPKLAFDPSNYNRTAKRKVDPAKWEPAKWDVVYKTNPPKSALPPGLPRSTETHMFGPDALLVETPAGRYRDWPIDDDC